MASSPSRKITFASARSVRSKVAKATAGTNVGESKQFHAGRAGEYTNETLNA
jgi:hypothetical protein